MFESDNTKNLCRSPRTLERKKQQIAKYNLHTEKITDPSPYTLYSDGKIQDSIIEKHYQSPARR